MTLPKVPAYRALDLMDKKDAPHVPTFKGRRALYKVAGIPAALAEAGAYAPTWSWTHPTKIREFGRLVLDLDCTAAFVAAASSGNYAFDAYVHTGPDTYSDAGPGYYKIRVHDWQVPGIVSPLGTAEFEPGSWVWVMQPTLRLLEELCERYGYWPSVDVADSYTCATGFRALRPWAERVRDDRRPVRARLNRDPYDLQAFAEYEAIKHGYAMAVQMWATPYDPPNTPFDQRRKKNETYRPDWYATLHAQHAASTWRRGFACLMPPFSAGPVAMGDRDEITVFAEDLEELTGAARPALRLDPEGFGPGTYKVKRSWFLGTCATACDDRGHTHSCTDGPDHDGAHHADACTWTTKENDRA